MIITYTEDDEQDMGEPIFIVTFDHTGSKFHMKFCDGVTREQIEVLQQKVPAMLEQAAKITAPKQ